MSASEGQALRREIAELLWRVRRMRKRQRRPDTRKAKRLMLLERVGDIYRRLEEAETRKERAA